MIVDRHATEIICRKPSQGTKNDGLVSKKTPPTDVVDAMFSNAAAMHSVINDHVMRCYSVVQCLTDCVKHLLPSPFVPHAPHNQSVGR